MNYTTIEQSKKLLELGLSPETADMFYFLDPTPAGNVYHLVVPQIGFGVKTREPEYDKGDVPCWSVEALLELMPKMFYIEGKDDLIEVALLLAKDQVIYEYTEYDDNYEVFRSKIGNFIDCLYETVCWLLQNNYIKTE